MNKIFYAVAIILGMAIMPGCHDNKNEKQQSDELEALRTELADSLATASAEKDSLLALIDEINAGMLEIKEMQKIVSADNLSHETPDRKEQLRSDMLAIQRAVAERQRKLDELERRLSQSTNYNEQMKHTIETLKTQLAAQQSTIDDLKAQLAAAHVEISTLNTRVDSLDNAVSNEREQKQAAQEENRRLTDNINELNTVYYAIGSKKELKARNIIEGGGFLRKSRIMEGDFDKNYFTRADKRTLSDIDLHSRKVKVLTKQPKSTYKLVDEGNSMRLVITDPNKFWETSNYLVVQID